MSTAACAQQNIAAAGTRAVLCGCLWLAPRRLAHALLPTPTHPLACCVPLPPSQGGEALPALPLHPLRLGEKYYLALFLTGVYQEVMGSIHNMFGSLNTVVVRAAAEAEAAPGGAGGVGAGADVSPAVPAEQGEGQAMSGECCSSWG